MFKLKPKKIKPGKNPLSPTWQACLPLLSLIVLFWAYAASAQEPAVRLTPGEFSLKVGQDTLWTLICAFLVFWMNAGFCMVEAGFCRRKNAVNLLAKNLIVFALSTIGFWHTGFAIMFGDGNGFMGLNGWFVMGPDNSPLTADAYEGVFSSLSWATIPLQAKFFFQLVFAGTAATIVSGAVAERIKFIAFLLFSVWLTGLTYPIIGHWIWGGGWLAQLGMYDFAGSTVVHSVGGWSALLGAVFLGPRLGRYPAPGQAVAMPGHNLAIATLGGLILWLGWFGFNPGSTMTADPGAISHIVVTTNAAAAFAAVAATLTSWLYFGQPDLSMIINGTLAGLVAITCSCAFVNVPCAVLIGLIAGILVVFSVVLVDRWRVDDPVGAVSVHLVSGIWGTLALGLFAVGPQVYSWYGPGGLVDPGPAKGLLLGGGISQLLIQLLGVAAVALFICLANSLAWWLIQTTVGLRVSAAEELQGLDLGEHGMEAYSGFLSREEIKGFLDLLKKLTLTK